MSIRGIATALFLPFLFLSPAIAADPALVDAARKEGRVMWYTGLLAEEAAIPIARAFMAKYPGIEVQHNRMVGAEIGKTVIAEAKAGVQIGDVFDSTNTVVSLSPAGMIEPYVSPSAADIPDNYKDKNGLWAAQVLYFTTAGYNTKLVSASDAPKTFEDLLDPKWKGKLGWSSTGTASGVGFVGNVLLTMGEPAGREYLKKLSAQQVRTIKGGGAEALQAVADGTIQIGLQIFNHHTRIQKAKGGAVEWIKMEPLLAFPNPIGIIKGAPHPNAARLLIDFVLSEEGQRVLQEANHIPASAKVEPPDATLKNGFKVNFLDPVLAERESAKWRSIVKELFE